MFKRKLNTLGYHHPSTFDINDRQQFTSLIVWLEDIKIRLYKIDDRKVLRDSQNENWSLVFKQYLKDLECPLDGDKKEQVLDWILGHAVRLEYTDKASEINEKWEEQKKLKKILQAENDSKQTIRNLQADDPDLKASIASLAQALKIPNHEDPLVRLQAVRSLIEHKLTEEARTVASTQSLQARLSMMMLWRENCEPIRTLIFSYFKNLVWVSKKIELDSKFLQNMNLGFDTGDSAVNEAAKILRLLHVSELRELQTSITQAIVAVQSHTANPKTDTKLGKVGI